MAAESSRSLAHRASSTNYWQSFTNALCESRFDILYLCHTRLQYTFRLIVFFACFFGALINVSALFFVIKDRYFELIMDGHTIWYRINACRRKQSTNIDDNSTC